MEHASAFNGYDDCIASLPSTFTKLGPKEQNNFVTGRFENRLGGNEILRTALTHGTLGAAGGEEEPWQAGGQGDGHEAAFHIGLGCAWQPHIWSWKDESPNVFQ